jgi:Protein of unknown function (DUF2000)
MQFDTKIAIVLDEQLAGWQKVNVTAFLISGISATDPALIGEPYIDGSGNRYLPMCRQPIIVSAADRAGSAAPMNERWRARSNGSPSSRTTCSPRPTTRPTAPPSLRSPQRSSTSPGSPPSRPKDRRERARQAPPPPLRLVAALRPRGGAANPGQAAPPASSVRECPSRRVGIELASDESRSTYAAGLRRCAAITLATPTTITASGMGHHQCSQKAARPWPLSRPAQKTPSSTNRAPSTWPTRFTVKAYCCQGFEILADSIAATGS